MRERKKNTEAEFTKAYLNNLIEKSNTYINDTLILYTINRNYSNTNQLKKFVDEHDNKDKFIIAVAKGDDEKYHLYSKYDIYYKGSKDNREKRQRHFTMAFDDIYNIIRKIINAPSELITTIKDTNINIDKDSIIILRNEIYLSVDDEFRLIIQLLNDILEKGKSNAYRYMSLSSFMRKYENATTENYEESMCCILAMNDKNECANYKKELMKNAYNKGNITNEEYNNYFITSLSTKGDNLTMWRLYGDDCKGVCIEYELQDPNWPYYKVLYNGSKKEKEIEEKKDEFENTIKGLTKIKVSGAFHFCLRKDAPWWFFIKDNDYEVEDEIRLLYHYNKEKNVRIKWINNPAYNIIHPIALFNNNDYPLKIKKVILGNNMPQINKEQIETMLKQYKTEEIEIINSKITSYR